MKRVKNRFEVGQRVRLTRDFLDTTTNTPPIHLYKDDEGTVFYIAPNTLGFESDRWDGIVSISRVIDGQYLQVLDYCEPINPQLAETQKLPDFEEGEGLL